MKFLADQRLYSDIRYCLDALLALDEAAIPSVAQPKERYHFYWQGVFGPKQAFAIKSFLATQDLESCEAWLWLDADGGYDGHEDSPLLRPFLPYVQVMCFKSKAVAAGTPFEGQHALYDLPAFQRADFARMAILYRHGGTYADFDIAFLRDMRLLRQVEGYQPEFTYQWSNQPCANSAILRLEAGSDTARALIEHAVGRGSCHPREALLYEDNTTLDLLVLPSGFFDPLWLHVDGADKYPQAPFDSFRDFFRAPDWKTRLARKAGSPREMFPGALAYHWHNYWDAPERPNSWYGLLDRAFDHALGAKLKR